MTSSRGRSLTKEEAVTFVTADADSDYVSSDDEYTFSSSEEVTYIQEEVVENTQSRK